MDDIDIIDLFWEALDPDSEEAISWVEPKRWEVLYDHGFVDAKRIPKARWIDLLKNIPKEEGRYRFDEAQIAKVAPFLYKGPIRKPFDPMRLKDGIRPESWLMEMYQKVLKFETTLKLADWSQIIEREIKPRFQVKDEFRFDKRFKEWLSQLLETQASPLRRLEKWVHEGTSLPGEKKSEPEEKKTPSTAPVPDQFVGGAPQGRGIQKIEKPFYQDSAPKDISDQEVLSFLEELEDMEDDEENPLKDH